MPFILFVLTCFSTYLAGGVVYSVCLMTILTFHELGHFLQSLRYGVRTSLPYFLPMPFLGPIGTLGAVIRMDGQIPNRKALFDIGISGPLAGLVPTLIFCYYGMQMSRVVPLHSVDGTIFGDPLVLQWIQYIVFGSLPPDLIVVTHPMAFAGWVGLLITSINLMPLSQLDGGHIFYAIAGNKARTFASLIFLCLLGMVVIFQKWQWMLMLLLIWWIGVEHPPTADDTVSLDGPRKLLGCGTLAFLLIGFTPDPIVLDMEEPQNNYPPAVVWHEPIPRVSHSETPNDVLHNSGAVAPCSSITTFH